MIPRLDDFADTFTRMDGRTKGANGWEILRVVWPFAAMIGIYALWAWAIGRL